MPKNWTIRGHEIATLLDRAPAGLRVLSLDCFDTLIWRNTHAPSDVFAAIDLPGGGTEQRVWAEDIARRMTFNATGSHEIGLADVYRRLHLSIDDEAVEAAVAHELAQEAAHAFAYTPTVELMRAAKARGLSIVIVSDMYLTEAQLRAHITAAAGEAVMAMIDHVFVSADHGVAKGNGLFDHVLARLGVPADTILHVGDNKAADHDGALAHGIHAAHFLQFDTETQARLRQEAVAAVMVDAGARVNRPVCQPHRAQVSLRTATDTAEVLGHDVLGPTFHSFALWLKAEVDAMAARLGKPVRPLFLLRDGYLPFQVFDALYPDAGARAVEISRIVAARASMYDAASLKSYCDEWLDGLPLKALGRHMMLYEHEMKPFIKGGETLEGRKNFARFVRKPEMQAKILKRTRAYGAKLMAHLARAGVGKGDAVMLVDIGYNGSVQNILTPVLRDRMGLTVAGRYLFLREGQVSGLDKAGLIDTRHFECRTLHAMSTCVAVIEQLCNVAQGSTTDFTAEGEPIREPLDIKGQQNAVRDRVQAACLRFAREAATGQGVLRAPASDTIESRTRAAGATMARLFFMPSASEVALFETFDHEVNLGSNITVRLADTDDARAGMRRAGLTYVNEKRRTYVPGEIHRHGLPMTMTLFASARFGLDLRSTDFEVGGVPIPVILLGADDAGIVEKLAYPTIDGFYRLNVPVGVGRFVPGVQFGHACEWLQIEEVVYHAATSLQRDETDPPRAVPYRTDGMEMVGPGLYRATPTGILMAPPPVTGEPQVLTVVFRPIHWRGEAAGVAQAA